MIRAIHPLQGIVMLVSVLALVVAGSGAALFNAGSVMSRADSALADVTGYSLMADDGMPDGEVSEDVARMPVNCVPSYSGRYTLCCVDLIITTYCWVHSGQVGLEIEPSRLLTDSDIAGTAPGSFG